MKNDTTNSKGTILASMELRRLFSDLGCLQKSRKEKEEAGRQGNVNARFIILDPNGEYFRAFADYDDVRRFQVSPKPGESVNKLLLPAWMWNSQEWSAFAHAAPQVQRPLLLQALRDMRAGARLAEPAERQAARLIRSYKASLESRIAQGVSGYQGFPANKDCGYQLHTLGEDSQYHASRLQGQFQQKLEQLASAANQLASSHDWQGATSEGYNNFSEADLRTVVESIDETLLELPEDLHDEIVSEDAPIAFDVKTLPDHLERIAAEAPGAQTAQFLATLTMRVRMMLADRRLGPVVAPNDESTMLEQWLQDYIGKDQAENGQVAIVDLSLVPSDVLHILIAVVARIVFEATQRYRKLVDEQLPTVLVLEEAHTFIKQGRDEDSGILTSAQMCCQTFERIAREGRKFGLGLVLASQRPYELSPTVLAQCNTFILHRIVNDRDQELVGKLVPDNLGGLLKELPSLPSRQAILLGWATPIPTLVEINELPEEQRPKSEDPEFWKVWTGEEPRTIDWESIVADWKGQPAGSSETVAGDESSSEP